MATAAIKPRAEAACRHCQGGAVKTKGQWLKANVISYGKRCNYCVRL